VRNVKGRNRFQDPFDVHVRTDFKERGSKVVSLITGSTLGPLVGTCEYTHEPLCFI